MMMSGIQDKQLFILHAEEAARYTLDLQPILGMNLTENALLQIFL